MRNRTTALRTTTATVPAIGHNNPPAPIIHLRLHLDFLILMRTRGEHRSRITNAKRPKRR